MAKFKITYNSGDTEEVVAERWLNKGPWVVFMQGPFNQVLQVKNAQVKRVEVMK